MHAGRAFISPLPPEVNIRHFELYRESVLEDRPIVELEARPDESFVLTVIGRERHGLLADLTNYLESVRMNVVQARIFSLPNDSIMDMFQLTDPHRVLQSTDAVKELHDSLFRLIGVQGGNPAATGMASGPTAAPPRDPDEMSTGGERTTALNAMRNEWIGAFATARPVTSNIAPRQGTNAMRRCLSNIVLTQIDSVELNNDTQPNGANGSTVAARGVQIVRDSQARLQEGEWFYGYSAESLKRYRFKYNVSEDKKYLCWGDVFSVRLSHCVGVVFGPYSNVFRQVGPARIEPDWLCFSLVSFPPANNDDNSPAVPRTYDFVCVDDAQLERWLLGLQALCRTPNTAQLYNLPGLILQRCRFKIQAHAHARKLTIRQYVLKRARESGERKRSENAVIRRDEEVQALEEAVRNLKTKLQKAANRETLLNTSLLNVQLGWETSIAEVTVNEVIGKGAYSEMWRGIWRSTPVAVKLLKPSSSEYFRDDMMPNSAGATTSPGSTDTMAAVSASSLATPNGSHSVSPPNAENNNNNGNNGGNVNGNNNMPRLSDADARFLREFHEEVTTLSKLRHPNIVLFMAACVRPPQLAILTEFCHGGSLFGALRRRSWRERITLNDFIVIARHIARGMRFLHANNIIHRDLKSQNLLLDRTVEEGCPVIKIADFGLSRRFKHGGPNLSMSGSTPGIMTSETGTYRWMAPEVIRHEPYSQKIDVYSFGVVVWELFACEIPFFGMTPIQAAFAVADKNLRPTAATEYGKAMPMPVGWMELVSRCWHPSAHFRPRFKDIVGALDEMEKGKPDKMSAYWRKWDEGVAHRRRMRRETSFAAAPGGNMATGILPNSVASSRRTSNNNNNESTASAELSRMQRGGISITPPGTSNSNSISAAQLESTGRQQTTGLGHSGSAPNLRAVGL